jgi:hypothetical protein
VGKTAKLSINDSIALKIAEVAISLRGASSIATDTAHFIFGASLKESSDSDAQVSEHVRKCQVLTGG